MKREGSKIMCIVSLSISCNGDGVGVSHRLSCVAFRPIQLLGLACSACLAEGSMGLGDFFGRGIWRHKGP